MELHLNKLAPTRNQSAGKTILPFTKFFSLYQAQRACLTGTDVFSFIF